MATQSRGTEAVAPKPFTSGSASDREFLMTRIVDAPRARVFKAWTDPAQLAAWWGPKGFTTPVCELDVRPGGRYRIVMRGPDGIDYPLKGVYREVFEPERLVLTDNWEDHPRQWMEQLTRFLPAGTDVGVKEALNTVTFEDYQGKTKLTIRTTFESTAVRDAMLKLGMSQGWAESLERLEKHLGKA